MYLSGIVTIVFCGISMARYALSNVSQSAIQINRKIYEALSHTFESLLFIFIGVGFVTFDLAWRRMGLWLFVFAFLIINFARFISITIISAISNKTRSSTSISKKS